MNSKDIKFDKAIDFPRTYKALAANLVPELTEVAQTFAKNLNRIEALLGLPLNVTITATGIGLADHPARLVLNLPALKKLPSPDQPDPPLSQADRQRLWDKVVELMSNEIEAFYKTEDAHERLEAVAIHNFNQLIESWCATESEVATYLLTAIQALFANAVITAWTAFEVLAGDLWVTCVNKRPRLAFFAAGAEIEAGDDPKTVENKEKMSFKFPFPKLRDPRFDPRENMGFLLKDEWNFDNRKSVENAYKKAFRFCEEDIEKIFRDKSLIQLALCRHSMIHDAGIANKDFQKAFADHPKLKVATEGKEIVLDGELVMEFVSTAVKKGEELLVFANNWLKNYKT